MYIMTSDGSDFVKDQMPAGCLGSCHL